jgi:hypothetical protein
VCIKKFIQKSARKRLLWKSTYRWESETTISIKYESLKMPSGIIWLRENPVWGSSDHGNETSSSRKGKFSWLVERIFCYQNEFSSAVSHTSSFYANSSLIITKHMLNNSSMLHALPVSNQDCFEGKRRCKNIVISCWQCTLDCLQSVSHLQQQQQQQQTTDLHTRILLPLYQVSH